MSSMGLGQSGVLQVVPPAQLEAQLAKQAQDKAAAAQPQSAQDPQQLVSYIKGQFEIMRNHRNTAAGWSERLLVALRTFNGQYDANKLNEIRQFGGSEIYARVIAQKCRAASSLLRDIYLGQDRPWGVKAPAAPDVPQDILANIDQLMQHEQQMMAQAAQQPPPPPQPGQPPAPPPQKPTPDMLDERRRALVESAGDAAKKKAIEQARESEDKIEDMLQEGGFYHAMAEFLVDLPIFPFAVIKGPVVRIIPTVTWPPNGGKPTIKQTPKLTWCRVSPFDLWFTPGVADIENACTIEKLRLTRAELNELLDLPGYNTDEIRAVLDEYGRGGLYDNWDTTDAERAVLENRENPAWNRSALISMMEYNGNVQGRLLQDYGLAVPDELRDYYVQVWCIGNHVIKAHLSPSPRNRHPYFITSFEKVPGTPVGNGLTDLLVDMQEAANATLRGLINNLSISSGPQVVVDDSRLSPDETGEDLYPWKRWHVRNDPVGNNTKDPITFFMPTSNAQQLIEVYEKFVSIADDVSAIPKYVGGQAGAGGAGRTASGLAMLMGNASKILQTVSANIDREILEPLLLQLADLIMLTDTTGLLTGEERISVQGVSVAVQRETLRQRQIEFLQATNNPTDQHIIGLKGRAAVLRSVSRDIGLDGEEVVPPVEEIEKMQQQEEQQKSNGNLDQKVQEGIEQGVKAGVSRISTELTAGILAQHEQMPEGAPTHIGTPPGGPGGPVTQQGQMPHEQRAAQADGQEKPRPGAGMGPTSGTVTGNMPHPPGPGGPPRVSPGVG